MDGYRLAKWLVEHFEKQKTTKNWIKEVKEDEMWWNIKFECVEDKEESRNKSMEINGSQDKQVRSRHKNPYMQFGIRDKRCTLRTNEKILESKKEKRKMDEDYQMIVCFNVVVWG